MLWWFLIMGDQALCSAATEKFGAVWCEPVLSSSGLVAVPHLPFLLVSRYWCHFVMPTDSPDAPGLGCIWGGICPVALFSSGKGPHLGPYLVRHSVRMRSGPIPPELIFWKWSNGVKNKWNGHILVYIYHKQCEIMQKIQWKSSNGQFQCFHYVR